MKVRQSLECSSWIVIGGYVNSLGELDTRCMDSVWLVIKTSWKMNDYSRSVVDHSKAAMILRVLSW